MNTNRIGVAIVTAIVVVAGCGGASVPSSGAIAGSAGSPPAPSASSALSAPSSAVATVASAVPASAGAIGVPNTCAIVTPAEIETAVGMPFEAGQDVTADLGWSSACAWVEQAAAGQAQYNVNLKVLANGTLAVFAKMAGAHPVAGLGDEAYAFDDGRQIAIRFGQLVAVVAGARGIDGKGVPAVAVEALARLIAGRIGS